MQRQTKTLRLEEVLKELGPSATLAKANEALVKKHGRQATVSGNTFYPIAKRFRETNPGQGPAASKPLESKPLNKTPESAVLAPSGPITVDELLRVGKIAKELGPDRIKRCLEVLDEIKSDAK